MDTMGLPQPALATAETGDATRTRQPSALGRATERIATLGAMLWTGVLAGYFLAFSLQVMPGMAALSGLNALAALPVMQSISEATSSRAFAVAFLGAVVLVALALTIAAVRREGLASWVTIVGGATFLVGALAVTLIFNRPLDDDLGGWSRTDPASVGLMEGYVRDWSRWNDVRLVSSLIAFALFAVAVLLPRHAAPAAESGKPKGPVTRNAEAEPDWLAGV